MKRKGICGNLNRIVHQVLRDWASILRYGTVREESHHRLRVRYKIIYDAVRFFFLARKLQLLSWEAKRLKKQDDGVIDFSAIRKAEV